MVSNAIIYINNESRLIDIIQIRHEENTNNLRTFRSDSGMRITEKFS